ncbi:hypothetical protein BD414DRAFT_472221 [Trametes punicea]|nr:hypothetical protein BD414DRAFT_472221 [Trametes punicea]
MASHVRFLNASNIRCNVCLAVLIAVLTPFAHSQPRGSLCDYINETTETRSTFLGSWRSSGCDIDLLTSCIVRWVPVPDRLLAGLWA